MSVLYPADRGDWWAPIPEACYYCSRDFAESEPLVFWHGDGGENLVLHQACAAALGVHLISDAREALLASGENPWSRRAALALRSSLLAAEGVSNA